MNDTSKQDTREGKKSIHWTAGFLVPRLLRRRTFGLALVLSLMAIIYWGVIASDRYVSEAHIVVQQADTSSGQVMGFANMFGGLGKGGQDHFLLRDHLLSVDMLLSLDRQLDLRAHFSSSEYDLLSRMWSEDAPLEWFHEHYLSRVSVEFDQNAGILLIKAQAYTPEKAHAIVSVLVIEGERYINRLAQELAEGQVLFLEEQVKKLQSRLSDSRQKVLDFQNRTGLVSPEGRTESLIGIVSQLEGRLSELQTALTAKQGYLMPDSPDIVEIKLQIAATEKQIRHEKKRLASATGESLNVTVDKYQRLKMESEFDLEILNSALAALESGRVDATRNLKKASVIQKPTMPQYPLEPRRIYNVVVFILGALLIAGIVHMLAAIIRDHRE